MLNAKNMSYILFLLIGFNINYAQAGPFGLEQGISKEHLDILDEIGPHKYLLKSINKPHPEFEKYVVLAPPKEGLCTIWAIGKHYSNDRYGSKVKSAHSNIKSQLEKSYGKSDHFDYINSDGLWQEDNEWVMSVMQNERSYATAWSKEKGSKLREGIETILLQVVAVRPDESNLILQYDFSNKSRCEKELDVLQSGNL
jgi:hypothetical protein